MDIQLFMPCSDSHYPIIVISVFWMRILSIQIAYVLIVLDGYTPVHKIN